MTGLCASSRLSPPAHDLRDRHVLDLDGLLQQPVEEHAAAVRVPAVEAKGELVEVEVELADADPAVVRAEEPALEQRGDAVNAGQVDVCGITAGRHDGLLPDVSVLG